MEKQPMRLLVADLLDSLAKAQFVRARETLASSHLDPMVGPLDPAKGVFPTAQSTLRWQGASLLRWTHERFEDERDSGWRRGGSW